MTDKASIAAEASGRSVTYTVTGSEGAVRDAIDQIKRTYSPMGYGTAFTEPREAGPGQFTATGYRQTSCD